MYIVVSVYPPYIAVHLFNSASRRTILSALLIWMLMHPMFVSCFLGSTNLFIGIRPPAVVPHGANGGVQRGITPLAH